MADLREECAALRDCLCTMGVVSREAYLAQLHRRRFAAARRAHPCPWETSLAMSLQDKGLAALLSTYMGTSARHSLGSASRHLAGCMIRSAGMSSTAPTSKLYAIGGTGGTGVWQQLSTTECYEPEVGAWRTLPPMSQCRANANASVVSGCLYVCGGSGWQGPTRQPLRSAERFDPGVGAWEALPDMREGRCSACPAAILGRLYICGGLDGYSEGLTSAECYDPVTGTWEVLPSMAEGRYGACSAVIDDRLHICGGRSREGHAPTSVECYDPVTRSWLLGPRMDRERFCASAAVLSGCFYVCGGQDSDEQVTASVERLGPGARGPWEPLSPMAEERCCASIATIAGSIYVCGGSGNASQPVVSSVERYSPAAGAWEMLPRMAELRGFFSATSFAGRLYICGGWGIDALEPLRSVEIYDAQHETWEAGPALLQGRCSAMVIACAGS